VTRNEGSRQKEKLKEEVTTQVDRLKVDRLKEKRPACAAGAAGRLAGDCVMDDHYCPSVFSLNT
jgi:hypothetical protein